VKITSRQQTADNIRQRFLVVEPSMKLEALARIIEAEDFDGMIIFVKTKMATVEVADYLRERGYAAAALNGDIAQNQRERTVEQLKEGVFNILVATDVAARGLDVQRITHVINYDLPGDSEAYVHRIGRTGRAGRKGHAIVFVAPKQRGFLREIDRAAGDSIEPMSLPTAKDINSARVEKFKEKLAQAAGGKSNPELFATFEQLVSQTVTDKQLDPLRVIAGLAAMMHGDRPFFIHELPERLLNRKPRNDRSDRPERAPRFDRSDRRGGDAHQGPNETFRVEVGRIHGVKPGNIVGAIVNEIGLDPAHIGHIRIEHDFSTVDLPSGMSRDVFKVIGRAWVLGRQLRISKLSDHPNFDSRSNMGQGSRGGYARRPRPEGLHKDKQQGFGGKPKWERRNDR
jgi:ATP-dependent RNA helicase DeaD